MKFSHQNRRNAQERKQRGKPCGKKTARRKQERTKQREVGRVRGNTHPRKTRCRETRRIESVFSLFLQ
nr:MAG TPA: hypothetical protein [Caudoviricetes sp.]